MRHLDRDREKHNIRLHFQEVECIEKILQSEIVSNQGFGIIRGKMRLLGGDGSRRLPVTRCIYYHHQIRSDEIFQQVEASCPPIHEGDLLIGELLFKLTDDVDAYTFVSHQKIAQSQNCYFRFIHF